MEQAAGPPTKTEEVMAHIWLFPCDIFLQNVRREDGWFSRLVQMWAKPQVRPTVQPPRADVAPYPTLTFVAMARR